MEEPLAKVADFDVGQRDGVTVAVVGEEFHEVGGVGDVVAHGVFRCVLVYRQFVVKAVKCVDVFGTQPVMLRFASCGGVVRGSRHSSRVRHNQRMLVIVLSSRGVSRIVCYHAA